MGMFLKAWSKAKDASRFVVAKLSQVPYFFSYTSSQLILYTIRGIEGLIGYVRYNFWHLVVLTAWQVTKSATPSVSVLHYAHRYQQNVVEPFYNSAWMLFLAAKLDKVFSVISYLMYNDAMMLKLGGALLLIVIGLGVEPIGTLLTLGIRGVRLLQELFLPLVAVYSLLRFVPLKAQYPNILGYQRMDEGDVILFDTMIKLGLSAVVALILAANPFGSMISHYLSLTFFAHNAVVTVKHMNETDAAYRLAFIPLVANLLFAYVSVIRLLPITTVGIVMAKNTRPIIGVACSLRQLALAIPDSGYTRQEAAR